MFAKNNRIVAASIAAIVLATSAPQSFAATATGSLTISANVVAACTVVGSAIAFGAYTQAVVNQTGGITVLCTNGTAYNVGLDAGTGAGATTAARKMTGSGGGTLNYALYRDSGRTNNWGSTIGTDTLTGTGSGLIQSLTVYGQVAAAQTPLAGTYSDTVTVTLTY
ncbi:spore coat U domain-containing protein [Herbaspirillum sp. alder98]|uniref:Csu type fimbrial protein n=1 Tax=Herbaspirillum sp. alder98 TaxID=2913096 RepID=UPI001CD8EC30|nr:spore coat U domain-containing protein [Herbaspirillum sp. alder98]MCA1324012.1 spore coat U domain-containing protein [Herbaspirillum sp. alder98]MCA1325534.1 spore coat U domain-containing protein [Herbaspirillum sp. alder98]MCA1325535.1 spore coat U domain-containing protein [Herbaspirillum sp. alder98]MCA1326733.1 spore coat U domain-containing protein [Herbaspirillum sp. alder98]